MFFIFSVAGWLMEVTLKYIQYHRFINRGFLIGPYCPVYGWGVVILTLVVGGVMMREGTMGEMFLAGFVVCGVLEYATSFYMEKFFHARWWDYSQKPMNLHGRIWIGNLVLFGIASVVIAQWIDPWYFSLVSHISDRVITVIGVILVIVYISDNIASHFLMGLVKKEIDKTEKDNTEEISREIHLMLQDRNLLVRRINQAYPDWQAKPARLTAELKARKKEYREAVKQLKALEKAALDRRLDSWDEILHDRFDKIDDVIQDKFENLDDSIKEKFGDLDDSIQSKAYVLNKILQAKIDGLQKSLEETDDMLREKVSSKDEFLREKLEKRDELLRAKIAKARLRRRETENALGQIQDRLTRKNRKF